MLLHLRGLSPSALKQRKYQPCSKCQYKSGLESNRKIFKFYSVVSRLQIQCYECTGNSLDIRLFAINICCPAGIIRYRREHKPVFLNRDMTFHISILKSAHIQLLIRPSRIRLGKCVRIESCNRQSCRCIFRNPIREVILNSNLGTSGEVAYMVSLILKSLIILLYTIDIYPYLCYTVAVCYDIQIILLVCYLKIQLKTVYTRSYI